MTATSAAPSKSVELGRLANLRDLGGGSGHGGMRVRRGQLFRSAMLDAEDAALLEALRSLGLRTIFDFRSDGERSRVPTPWEATGCAEYWCRLGASTTGNLGEILARPTTHPAEVRDEMFRIYRVILAAQAPSFQALFGKLAAGATPLLFHCSVGKDRTGVAAALVLGALGVSREAVLEDYLQTRAFDFRGSGWMRRSAHLAGLPQAVIEPMLAADPAYLQTTFDELDNSYGSLEGYLADALEIGPSQLAAIRAHLLEPA
jgi:protein-tyrosine phosphatase